MSADSVAKMVWGITYDKIPTQTLEKAKLCVADYLGVLLGGKALPLSEKMIASLGGKDALKNPRDLAFWAGSTARIIDLDDGHRFAMGHPGVPTISAALAASVHHPVSGKTFLEAIVRGYETYGFLGRVINPPAYQERGFDSTGICGAVSATVSAGTIEGLSQEELAQAIGISGCLGGGLTQFFEDGSSPKYFCAGWAAKLGVTAAKLAKNGFNGSPEVFSGKSGFCQAFSPRYDVEYLRDPQVIWEVDHVYLKKYGCVRRVQAALDGVESICQENNLGVDDIEKVIVRGGRFVADSAKCSPRDLVGAQSSMPFTVAVLLVWGKVDLELLEKCMGDPVIEEVSRRVVVLEDEELNRVVKENPSFWGGAKVEIIDKKGNSYTRTVHIARGERENPFPEEVLQEKFQELASRLLSEKEADALWAEVKKLEECEQVGKVFERLIF